MKYPNGQPGIYGVVEKGPGVAVAAVDDSGRICLIRQYRYTLDGIFWELPAGAIQPGEDEAESARRELFEETGLRAGRLERLGNFYTALGHETAEIIAYLADQLETEGRSLANQQHDESILETAWISASQLKKMVAKGEVRCGIALAALGLLFVKHPDL